jgi:hypothetical protein
VNAGEAADTSNAAAKNRTSISRYAITPPGYQRPVRRTWGRRGPEDARGASTGSATGRGADARKERSLSLSKGAAPRLPDALRRAQRPEGVRNARKERP